MINKKTSLFLVSGVLVYSTIAVLIWQERYFYDDELINLNIITKYNYKGLLTFLAGFDFHPPGQYLINKFVYDLFGPDEWLMSLPSLICTGLSVGLAGLIAFRITKSKIVGYITILIAAVSPLILMWGWSVRWYPYWTLISFLSLFILLKIWKEGSAGKLYYAILAILLAAGLYLNYLSFIFFIALILASLVLDFKNKNFSNRKLSSTLIFRTVAVILCAVIFFFPWLPIFLSQVSGYFDRANLYPPVFEANRFVAGGYSLFTGLFGSSIYPWNMVFIILFATFLLSLIISGYFLIRQKSNDLINHVTESGLKPIIVFTIIYLIIIVAFTAFLKIYRSQVLLILPLLLSIILISFIYKIFSIFKTSGIRKEIKTGYSYLLLGIFFFAGIWLYGSINVINKQHLHKMGLSDPVSDVLKEIKRNIALSDKTVLVMTINPILSYYLDKGKNYEFYLIVPGHYDHSNNKKIGLSEADIIFVETYLGSLIPAAGKYLEIKNYLRNNGYLMTKPIKIGKDEDYYEKIEITSADYLPEYRFIIYKFKPKTIWNPEKIFQFKELSVD